MTVTVDELKKSHWEAVFFADGDDPKHIQHYRCREFPRFTKTATKPKRGDWEVVYGVDGVEVPRTQNLDDWLQSVADALNKDPAEAANV